MGSDRLRERLGDVLYSLATAGASGARGAARTARRAALGTVVGVRDLARRRRGGASLLALGIARLLLQLPADLILMLLVRTVSALQTLLGIEVPGRRLDEGERALLHRVFGDGIDARPVRLKVGRLGLLGLPGRAFVAGDTVHVPRLAPGSLATRAPELLVHELTHVWQHQRHGTRYMSECLLAQWLGEGYDVAAAVAAGRSFHELNFEQQAELVEQAFAAGWLADGGHGAQRLLVRRSERGEQGGLAVALCRAPEAAALLARGWLDATEVLVEGLDMIAGEPRAASGRMLP